MPHLGKGASNGSLYGRREHLEDLSLLGVQPGLDARMGSPGSTTKTRQSCARAGSSCQAYLGPPAFSCKSPTTTNVTAGGSDCCLPR